jgi:hypothetical protein
LDGHVGLWTRYNIYTVEGGGSTGVTKLITFPGYY